ncbi:hypothetical protein [Butyrivibrio fibrisolvens]|jgi:hypothetical protein|uniref:hypothetical protein n=1 Tax=Butyrivibrio fibrisolvens TaxID=831 RepID=UPI001788DB98|nr:MULTISPECIES: hypothetical protein [Butyrivibrio]MCR4636874.1 hypothetical protein [Butyrivibrio sp.]
MDTNMDMNLDTDFDELEAMFGSADADIEKMENVVLSNNLKGFASCFPEWDLHPPVER